EVHPCTSTSQPYPTLFRSQRIQPTLAHGARRQIGDRAQADQGDRHEDRGEGLGRARQLTIAVAHGLVVLVVEDGRTIGFQLDVLDPKSTRLNSSHVKISYA